MVPPSICFRLCEYILSFVVNNSNSIALAIMRCNEKANENDDDYDNACENDSHGDNRSHRHNDNYDKTTR